MISWPATPGKKYLLPPEMPTTSCGSTGPTTSATSCSTTARLSSTGTSIVSRPSDSSAIRAAGIVPRSANVAGLPPLVVEHGHAGIGRLERALRVAEVGGERRLAHRRVRAERDEHGHPADPPVQRAVHRARAAAAAGRCGCRRGRARRRCARRGRRAASCSRDERRDLGPRCDSDGPSASADPARPAGRAGSRRAVEGRSSGRRHAPTLAAAAARGQGLRGNSWQLDGAPARRRSTMAGMTTVAASGHSPSTPTGSCPPSPGPARSPAAATPRCATCRSSRRTATSPPGWLAEDIPFTDPTSLLISPGPLRHPAAARAAASRSTTSASAAGR